MKDINLNDITDEQLLTEAQLLINSLRVKYPKLDLRRGTVLRDLLIDSDAIVGAWFKAQADEQRAVSSLQTLLERETAGEPIDSSDVNAILSNFNMRSISGTKARGYVRVVVNRGDVSHSILEGVQFKTSDDIYFRVTTDTTASSNPSSQSEVTQHSTGTDNFWYLVPVEAVEVGASGNLEQGIALEPDTALADFVSASAYTTFSGGSDLESLNLTVQRIPASLSARGLTTQTATEAQLRDRFDTGEHPIKAVSVCGYGNPAQLRDKHNLFGVAVGGRSDIYVRNFTELPTSHDLLEFGEIVKLDTDSNGVEQGTATFRIFIPSTLVPGAIAVYSVSEPNTLALSSYLYTVSYSGDTKDVWHDLDIKKDYRELANTIWRDTTITVEGVPITEQDKTNGGKLFRVVMTMLPNATDLQNFVDDGLVRNVGADCIIRGPMIVNMSVNAIVRYNFSTGFNVDAAIQELCKYVNSTGFVGRITRSELSALLIRLGAVSVDLFDEHDMLYGYVYDAMGVQHTLSGDALDIDIIEDPKVMLTKDTTIFVLEPKNVQITTIAA